MTQTRIIWNGRRKAAEPRPPAIAEPAPAPPADGATLPDTSGGRVCQKCGAYIVLPDVHARYHRRLARFMDLVHDVFRARGYITTDENTATDGNSHE